MQEIKKIVVIGPESTGKSTLCSLLASHYNTVWCREYAREFLLNHGTDYTYEDLLTIARGQLLLQDATVQHVANSTWLTVQKALGNNVASANNSAPLIFIDTDMYVMKVWCEYVFGKCHQFILDEIIKQKYDLYLLCKPDIAWVKDELREYPDEKIRVELYHMYKDVLINQEVPWTEVSGDYEQRLRMAVKAVDNMLMSNL